MQQALLGQSSACFGPRSVNYIVSVTGAPRQIAVDGVVPRRAVLRGIHPVPSSQPTAARSGSGGTASVVQTSMLWCRIIPAGANRAHRAAPKCLATTRMALRPTVRTLSALLIPAVQQMTQARTWAVFVMLATWATLLLPARRRMLSGGALRAMQTTTLIMHRACSARQASQTYRGTR